MKRYRPNNKGITLIEMITVVAIIGILAAISLPNFIMLIRSNRVRSRAVDLLSVLRKERTRAISLARRIQVDIDKTNKTYTVTRLDHILYDPLSPDPFHPNVLDLEKGETLIVDAPFDPRNWLNEVLTVSPDPFSITFTPSGTVQMSVPISSIEVRGYHVGYEIKIYRAGQIDLFQL